MGMSAISIIENLEIEDKEKISYFIKLLLNKSSYQKLREEISDRREEINKEEILTHENIWNTLNV